MRRSTPQIKERTGVCGPKRIRVQFTKGWQLFDEGQIEAFDSAVVQDLLARGVIKILDAPPEHKMIQHPLWAK